MPRHQCNIVNRVQKWFPTDRQADRQIVTVNAAADAWGAGQEWVVETQSPRIGCPLLPERQQETRGPAVFNNGPAPHQPGLKRSHSVPRLSRGCFQEDSPGHAPLCLCLGLLCLHVSVCAHIKGKSTLKYMNNCIGGVMNNHTGRNLQGRDRDTNFSTTNIPKRSKKQCSWETVHFIQGVRLMLLWTRKPRSMLKVKLWNFENL